MRSAFRLSLSVLVVLLPFIVLTAESPREPIGRLVLQDTSIEWQRAIDHAPIILSVQHPDGEVTTETFHAGQTPRLNFDGLRDGLYSYELRAEGAEPQSGSFRIADGAIVAPTATERSNGRPPALPATATFFNDDVSATGGLCGGSDCTNAESYGFVTIKMKDNYNQIKFEDTSTSVGFPTTDWQVSTNDTFSGGVNKFIIQDLTAGTTPFFIEGASPNNTLYVDSNGRIGINTSTPAEELTIATAVSPTIRMEQSASPFQTWDIIANNNNWYVRNVNAEQNPFIIKYAAPYNTLVLDTTGRIGLGVASPAFQIDHSSGARLDAGSWVNASSRAVKQDIHQLDGATALDALKALEPVTFAYKANPGETMVGFIAEDVPDLVATADRKGLSSMDVAAVLTKVIQEQQKTIEEMRARLERLEQKE